MARPQPTFAPIAPAPGAAPPRVRRTIPQVPSGSAQTTRIRGSTGRFESRAQPSRRCALCDRTETSQWRTSVDGNTLCNACGIRLNRRPTPPAGKSTAARKRAAVKKAVAALEASAAARRADEEAQKNDTIMAHNAQFRLPPISVVFADTRRSKKPETNKKFSLQHILNP